MDRSSYLYFLGRNGWAKRERDTNRGRNTISRKAPQHVSFHSVFVDGVEMMANIISTTILTKKTMVTMPGDTFYLGQIVEWNDAHWIVVEKDIDSTMDDRGVIELCNTKLRWQNHHTGEIVERWAIIDKPYFSNLSENKRMTISQRKFNIQMPYDEETALIDIGKRLMPEIIDGKPKTYRITSVDTLTDRYKIGDKLYGCLILDYEQDQYNAETDNKELMICDYIDFRQMPEPPSNELYIEFNGTSSIKCGSPRKLYKAMCDGDLVSECNWSIVLEDQSMRDYVDYTINGGRCYIRIVNNRNLIGKHITLTVSCDGYTDASIDVEVISQ